MKNTVFHHIPTVPLSRFPFLSGSYAKQSWRGPKLTAFKATRHGFQKRGSNYNVKPLETTQHYMSLCFMLAFGLMLEGGVWLGAFRTWGGSPRHLPWCVPGASPLVVRGGTGLCGGGSSIMRYLCHCIAWFHGRTLGQTPLSIIYSQFPPPSFPFLSPFYLVKLSSSTFLPMGCKHCKPPILN